MNGELAKYGVGWTIETYAIYVAAMQQASREFAEERDRRYAEVNIEKEKALKIKETADLAALELAREIDAYKDEKANNWREQFNTDRNTYPTRKELEPFLEYVTSIRGRDRGFGISWQVVVVLMAVVVDVGSRFIKP